MMEWTDTTIPAIMVEPKGFTDGNDQSNGRPALMITSGTDDGVIVEGSRTDLLDWLAEATHAVLTSNREFQP